ncbi:katanin p80 WD40 repeat-containing subunit B1-like [Limulus polyphemus]|uniref:Katanin p80 WD40 repeat-containing subunit B1 n=1 Tax=Limulus polyphemus TaxID=6850 RepID=A0ABM1S3S7_LIMPO|nr:katanin p80 WD40 repeat-containing subunit B1-like [Limulus polyphemus]
MQRVKRPSSLFGVERKTKSQERKRVLQSNFSVRWEKFLAHGTSVRCLALGKKSGRVMVTGGEDKKVNLWAIGKPNRIMSLTGHTTAVECVRFGHAEDIICAGSVSGALKIWDLETARILRTLTGHKSNLKCLDFHPYGDFVASGSLDTNIKLWDIKRKGCIYTYKGHNKPVNNIKFSPDGRWIASAGDDGTIKLWDLVAGKMLKEFRGHTGPVTDVEFHPNEFLLASGSTDKSIRFWDLENFQHVSSTEGDCGPIRCIYFSPDGECVFGGAQDVLKVYGWEPSRTFDTVVMGWGKVADISTSQNELIAGAFSLTNVSIYVVDLKHVQPFVVSPTAESKSCESQTTFSPSNHVRKSFNKGQAVSNQTLLLQVQMVEDGNSVIHQTDSGDDFQPCVEINDHEYYSEIFHPSSELCRTPPKTKKPLPTPPEDLTKINDPQHKPIRSPENITSAKYPSLPEKSSSPIAGKRFEIMSSISPSTLIGSSSLSSFGLNTTYTKISDLKSPSQSSLQSSIGSLLPNSVKLMEKNTTVVKQTIQNLESPSVSIVRPIHIIPDKDVQQQKAIVFPKQQHITNPNFSNFERSFLNQIQMNLGNHKEFVPDQRDHPVGLELEYFLPKHLQNSLKVGGHTQPEISETEAMTSIINGHQSMMSVLQHRQKNLQVILIQWATKEPKTALDTAIKMNDVALIVDVLNIITSRSNVIRSDISMTYISSIEDLYVTEIYFMLNISLKDGKYILKHFTFQTFPILMIFCGIWHKPSVFHDVIEDSFFCDIVHFNRYMSVGCASLKLILKNFATVIKINITAPPGIGVDINREERYNKCVSCYNQLLSIRTFLLKRQTMQGILGHSFRELHLLMQGLE